MPCSDPIFPTLSIPAGPPGSAGRATNGSAGSTGTAGKKAYTTSTASFVMPNSGSTVTVNVEDTDWAAVGLAVFVANAGYFKITGIPGLTSFTLENLGTSENATPASTIASGQKVTPAGYAVLDGSVLTALDGRVTDLENGLVTAAGNRVFFQASAPGTAKSGDIWFNTADGNKIYVHDGSGWVDRQRVLSFADFGTGIRPIVKVSSLPSTGYTDGDFVILSTDGKLYRRVAGSWTKAVATGDLVGTVDGSTFIVDGTLIASKFATGSVTADAVGANKVITLAANIEDAIITDAKIISVAAAKIVTGNMVAVNLAAASRIYHPTYPSITVRTTDLAANYGSAHVFGTGTSFGFTHTASGATVVCPGHALAGTGPCVGMPDTSGRLLVSVRGTLLGYTGTMCVYYRKNNTGSYTALASVDSADGNVNCNREITGLALTDRLDFRVAPCNGNGDCPTTWTGDWQVDLFVYNW